MMELVVLFVLMVIAFLFIAFALNPSFWQGYRNTKFFDELTKEYKEEQKESKDIVK